MQCTNVWLSGRICGDVNGLAEQFCQIVFDCVHAMPGSFLQRVCLWDLCLAYVHVDGAFVLPMYMLVCQCLAHWEDYEAA